jgi:hypothetical protein
MKKTMTASRSMTYGTRRLMAGEEFEASRSHARLLVALGRAEYGTRAIPQYPPPAKKPAGDDLAALRAQYQETVGKRAFHGWDADTLKAKIAAAKG